MRKEPPVYLPDSATFEVITGEGFPQGQEP